MKRALTAFKSFCWGSLLLGRIDPPYPPDTRCVNSSRSLDFAWSDCTDALPSPLAGNLAGLRIAVARHRLTCYRGLRFGLGFLPGVIRVSDCHSSRGRLPTGQFFQLLLWSFHTARIP